MAGITGWSRAGAARLGRQWRPVGDRDCYYCGVTDCEECGEPPMMLQRSGIIGAPDEDADG